MKTVFELFSRVWLYQLCWVAMAVSQRTPHTFQTLTNARLQAVSQCSSNVQSLFNTDLPRILKERVPDTPGHTEVKEYIIARLNQLKCSRWKITLDTFTDTAPQPFGEKKFTNIIATLDPDVDKRLVLAAHYDSKYFSPIQGSFVGATDSAVPVALLLDLALTLDDKLCNRRRSDYSLQIMLFDGEEAFVQWTSTDSIYGSRHLAAEMEKQGGLFSVGDKTGLQAIEALILLDLIGSTDPYPKFYDMQKSGSKLFQRLAKIEQRLHREGHLEGHTSAYLETRSSYGFGGVEDDHLPFLRRGVPIVHLIPVPFPRVWHTLSDNGDAIDENMVTNFKKIFMVFLHEYFDLR